MAGIAQIATELGYKVTGSDQNVYPPMSTVLAKHKIELVESYDYEPQQHLLQQADMVIIGNALSRGVAVVEAILERNIRYTSAAQWLFEQLLYKRWVVAVAGTHGKTTTSAMLTWILEYAGLKPGYLIGGAPHNFSASAAAGEGGFFVIEADEYDTAFFDKRAKFVHYRPRTLCINNLEFDHGDIYPNLAAIQTQFAHLLRSVPKSGKIIYPAAVQSIEEVLARGLWSATETFSTSDKINANWQIKALNKDGSSFEICHGKKKYQLNWQLKGEHNLQNAISAILGARNVGVTVEDSIAALQSFKGVARRMQLIYDAKGIKIYDDFAHHPTAIIKTLQAMRHSATANSRIIALLELRSNTMRMGQHNAQLQNALKDADLTWILCQDKAQINTLQQLFGAPKNIYLSTDSKKIVSQVLAVAEEKDNLIIMSNGAFANIGQNLIDSFNKL